MHKESILSVIEERMDEFYDSNMQNFIEPYAIFCDMRTYAEIYENLAPNSDPYYIHVFGKKLKLLTEHPKNGLIDFEILYKLK